MKTHFRFAYLAMAISSSLFSVISHANTDPVADSVIQEQHEALKENTEGKGFGPQSPRDIDSLKGKNKVFFTRAPASTEMNLCNIHFHKNAEHKGGEFTRYAGNGDGRGNASGFLYSGTLTAKERAPVSYPVCANKNGAVVPGDTIEVHYVYSSAAIEPGPSLGACFNDATKNPQLRVEAQVFVVVNDDDAADFNELMEHEQVNGFHQAVNIPSTSGEPIEYMGSTTGPAYNEQGSPFQVTWSVRPQVIKTDIASVASWCEDNTFDEDHGHAVRNLVIVPELLSDEA